MNIKAVLLGLAGRRRACRCRPPRSPTSWGRSRSRPPAMPGCRRSFERGVAMLHSYWFTEARKVFDAVLQQDPELRDGVLGTGRQLSRQLAGGGAVAERRRGGLGGARQGARDRGQDPARARLDRGDRRLLSRRRQGAAGRPAGRLHPGDGADDAALPRRLRGVDVLRADLAGLGAEERQDVRQPAQVGGDPGAPVQAEPRAPRRGALPGPRLRLPAARRQGHHDRRRSTRGSRRPRRTPGTCPRTSTRWWGCGRSRSPRTASALEVQPDYHHATDFIVYAHLQLAQDAAAKALVDHDRGAARAASTRSSRTSPRSPRSRRATRSSAATGRGRPRCRSSATGRAHGRLRSSASPAASAWRAAAIWPAPSARSRRCRSCAPRSRSRASRTGPIAPRSRSSRCRRGSRYAEGARDQALKLMRAAADGEDGSVKHVAMENRLYPMRELLGELLLQIGQAGGRRCASSRPRSRKTPTAIAASPAPRAPPRRPATGRRPPVTSRSSSRCPARPTRRGRRWRTRRRSSAGGEAGATRARPGGPPSPSAVRRA